MNAPVGRAPAPPSHEPRRSDDEPRPQGGSEYRQAEAAFERLMRAKTSARERDDDSEEDTGGDGSPCAAPPQNAAAHPSAPSANAAGPAPLAATPEAAPVCLRASVEAAFGAPIPPAMAAGENANAFQVSISEPLGVPVDLRATRMPNQVTGAAAAGWSLNFSASGRDASLLARLTPRLHERLRARGLDADHVHVERDRDLDDDKEQR
jgi:hypothetical protein